VVFFLAIIGGGVTFFMIDNVSLAPMTFAQRLLSVGLYALLYVVITTAVLVFAAFVYNIFTGVLGLRGITLDIEELHHDHD
jgi:hypothetical protein